VLLFPFHSSTSSPICDEITTCLYFTTCFDKYTPNENSSILKPKNNAVFMSINDAINEKNNCEGIGLISKLSIVSNSLTSMNIAFESDLKPVVIQLGEEPNSYSFNPYDTNKGVFNVDGQQ
ncbi:hypothetical protein PMAYCL1PPCAC_28460, partial [Pristionchus mayeri]